MEVIEEVEEEDMAAIEEEEEVVVEVEEVRDTMCELLHAFLDMFV